MTKWPAIGIGLAAICISPLIYWNIQHDWMSSSYQIKHGAPGKSWQFNNLLISQATQFFSYSPAVFIFGLFAIYSTIKNKNSNNEQYLLAFSLPVLILFGLMSGQEQTLPHWTALGWIALTPLIAKWIMQNWHKASVRIISYLSLTYSFFVIITLHLLLATSLIPFENNQHPLEDIYGWKKVADKAVELQIKMQAEHKNTTVVIYTGNWSQFSRLAWYARPAAVQVTDQHYEQSDIWYGSPQIGSNGILVVPPKYKNTAVSGVNKFKRCELQENVSEIINDKVAATYELYRCYVYKG